MCKQCVYVGCPGCGWQCYCNHSCFQCLEPYISKYSYCHHFIIKSKPPREKFVCFDCLYVWKSKFTKYDFDKPTKDIPKDLKHDQLNSRCGKCGKPGIRTGSTFRPCKNKKQWNILIQKYKNDHENFVKDFTFYTRIQK